MSFRKTTEVECHLFHITSGEDATGLITAGDDLDRPAAGGGPTALSQVAGAHAAPVPPASVTVLGVRLPETHSQELTETVVCSYNPPRSEGWEGSVVPHKPLSRPDSSSQEGAPRKRQVVRAVPLSHRQAQVPEGARRGGLRLFQDRAKMERGDPVRTGGPGRS